MKYFRMSYKEVVFERSYANLILLNRAIPGFKPFDKDNEGGKASGSPKVQRKSVSNMHANDFFQQFM